MGILFFSWTKNLFEQLQFIVCSDHCGGQTTKICFNHCCFVFLLLLLFIDNKNCLTKLELEESQSVSDRISVGSAVKYVGDWRPYLSSVIGQGGVPVMFLLFLVR